MSPLVTEPRRMNPFLRLAAALSDRVTGRRLASPRILSHYPRTALGSGVMEALAAHPDGRVTRRMLKLVRLTVSFTAACPFCIDMNSSGYAGMGITDGQLEALRDLRLLASVDSFSREERAAVRYAAAATATPLSFPEDLQKELGACFSEREIVLLASAAAQVNFWARLHQALGIPPAGFPAACPIPQQMASPGAQRILAAVRSTLERPPGDTPRVTLAWAQSLNGAIARRRGERTSLSGPESLRLTHALRGMHGAILAGIGTILADDPQLSVRMVDAPQPRPVILDSRLRTPATARLLERTDMKPWIFHSCPAGQAGAELEGAGARLFRVSADGAGLSLREVLDTLRREGVGSVMVEGGAAVLQAFLAAGAACQAAVTISPLLMDGLPALAESSGLPPGLSLQDPIFEVLGNDVVVWGRLGA
jgi:riboflavin-specific deaminase-like protein